MPFADGEVEDGTGLKTAIVYDSAAAAAEYLSRRGYPAFAVANDAAQQGHLIRATEAAEDAIRDRLRSIRLVDAQGLLFPSLGAYDSGGRLLFEGETPLNYRRGIFLLAEASAAGKFMPHAGGAPGIVSESSRGGSVTYQPGTDFSSLPANHPEAWRLISTAIPRL